MKNIYTGVLAALLSLAAYTAKADADNAAERRPASDANITGHVESAKTKEHIPFITINIEGTTIAITSDATGHYFLKNLPEGDFTIMASGLGYKPARKNITLRKGVTTEVNFLLDEEAISIDGVVVSANRNASDRRQASTIVSVASMKLFDNTASSVLSETMMYAPGLRVENDCSNCGTVQLRINGLEGQYSQMLLDSRPIFSSLASVYGLEQLPTAMIERVEVTRGGGSALFGSSAIGGVVNIITREPLRNSLSLSNTTNFFPGGGEDTNTALSGSFLSDDQRAGVYLFGMVRRRDAWDCNDDGYSDLPGIRAETIGFRGYYRTSTYSRLRAEYHHIHEFRRGGNNLDLPPHEANIAEQVDYRIDGGGLEYELWSRNRKHKGSVYASAQGIERESFFGAEVGSDSYGSTSGMTWVAGGQYTLSMERLLFMPAQLTAGVEYNYDNLDDRYVGLGRSTQQKTYTTGGYLQNEWKDDHWSILIGARLDKHNLVDNAILSPRANLRWSPTGWLGLRAGYSSGYRAPQTYNEDLHIAAVSGMLSVIDLDPNLKPEYSHSYTASADLYHSFGRLEANLLIEGFHTTLDDVFTLDKTGEDPDAGFIYYTRRNGSGARVMGLNFEARLGVPGRFDLQMGYTLQQSRYEQPEQWSDQLPAQRTMFRAPDGYGYFTANVPVTRALNLTLMGNYTGSMLIQHTTPQGDLEKVTRDFVELGSKVAYTFFLPGNMKLELNGGVRNALDQFQPDPDSGPTKDAAYMYGPALPRVFFAGIKFFL